MNRRLKLLLNIILLLIPFISYAQNIKSNDTNIWRKKITRVFDKMDYNSALKDSIAIYNYNIELRLEKSKNGNVKVIQLIPSDKIIYNLFPNYKQLYAIDYRDLLKNKKNVSLYIPILVFSTSPSGTSRYERQDNVPLVNINDATRVAYNALNSIGSFYENNSKNHIITHPVLLQIINIH